MKNQSSLISLLFIVIVMSACSASKKFDFANAYKFSHHQHKAAEQVKPEPIEEQTFTTSISTETEIVKDISTRVASEKEIAVKTWTKEEKKELKKEVKQELKRVKSEIKEYKKGNISTPPDMQSTQALDGKVYIGTVVGLAGLVLLILGVGEGLGALAVVVGLALIVWGLIQQGSF